MGFQFHLPRLFGILELDRYRVRICQQNGTRTDPNSNSPIISDSIRMTDPVKVRFNALDFELYEKLTQSRPNHASDSIPDGF
ncbi:MAG: hypothetical protein DWI24_10630 [Planctomycetota bacterium]|nr:MAG: hypothetical protein DWI24_10630 [Planctomycetota bacterium]